MPALLLRGLLVGLVSGLLAFGFAKVFGEPLVDQAIAFEQRHSDPADGGPELVSRAVQANAGLLVAAAVFGAALGGLFSLVFAYWHQRIPGVGARGTATLIAAVGFVAINLVPSLIYPANPPSVGLPATIQARTALYFGVLAISLAALALAIALARRQWQGGRVWNTAVLIGLVYVAVMLLTARALPAVDEVPADLPAVLLWKFRTVSLGMNLVLWSGLGLLYGPVVERVLNPLPVRAQRATRGGRS
jgi:Probable cobalt transporter subunit (CbtA)